MSIYVFLPSLRARILGFLSAQPKIDVEASEIEISITRLMPPFLITHELSQRIVDYLRVRPFEQVYQLINSFGALEPVDVRVAVPQGFMEPPADGLATGGPVDLEGDDAGGAGAGEPTPDPVAPFRAT